MIVSIYINDRRQETLFQYSNVAECPTFRQLMNKLQSKDAEWEQRYCSELNSELKVCKYTSPSSSIIYWCLSSTSESSMSVISLLEEIDLLLLQYFDKTQLSKVKINNNLDRLAMVFHCIFDGGNPVILESNRLKAMVPAKNDLAKMIKNTTHTITKTLQQSEGTSSFFQGAANSRYPRSSSSSISSFNVAGAASGGSGNPAVQSVDESGIPWRMNAVNYSNNELFIDMVEEVHASVKRDKLVTGYIKGQIDLNSHLSGQPLVEMDLDLLDHKLSHLNSTFHRCILEDKANNLNDLIEGKFKRLSFVPPDGRTRLCDYTIPLNARNSSSLGLVNVNLQTGLGRRSDEFEIRVTVGMSTKVSEVENINLTIKMNRNFKGSVRVMRNTHGGVETNMSRSELHWHLDKNMVGGSMAVLRCIAEPEGAAGTTGNSGTLVPEHASPEDYRTNTSTSHTTATAAAIASQHYTVPVSLLKTAYINCHYQHQSELLSGIKLKSIDVVNTSGAKPFKGVKYTTKTGTLEYR